MPIKSGTEHNSSLGLAIIVGGFALLLYLYWKLYFLPDQAIAEIDRFDVKLLLISCSTAIVILIGMMLYNFLYVPTVEKFMNTTFRIATFLCIVLISPNKIMSSVSNIKSNLKEGVIFEFSPEKMGLSEFDVDAFQAWLTFTCVIMILKTFIWMLKFYVESRPPTA